MPKLTSSQDLRNLRALTAKRREQKPLCVAICSGTGCVAARSRPLAEAFERQLREHNLASDVEIRRTGCFGLCELGPVVVIYPADIAYFRVKPEDAAEIVAETLLKNRVVERLLYNDLETGSSISRLDDIPFYKHQNRLLLDRNTQVDPTKIDDYIAAGGKKFKAIQTGGPSGGFLPESKLDLKVDFDELTAAGSMMGSGGMIVMDEDSCIVDAVRYYVRFLSNESCGACAPCREGLRQMLRILDRICAGKGGPDDIDTLEELSEVIQLASLCALGQTAPNPVLSAIRYFRDEIETHVNEKRCPAKVCVDLIEYVIDEEKCIGCGFCARKCPARAISGERKPPYTIHQEACIKCGSCLRVCPSKIQAVKKVDRKPALDMSRAPVT